MSAEPLARKIARGDRSEATAKEYLRAIGAKPLIVYKYRPPPTRIYSLTEGETHESEVDIHGVFAVGGSPKDAICSLADAKEWGEVRHIEPLESGDPAYTWGRRFTAGGTGFKAAGQRVPGGYVVTWWK